MTHEEISRMIGIDIQSEEWNSYKGDIASLVERYASIDWASNQEKWAEIAKVQATYGWTLFQVEAAEAYEIRLNGGIDLTEFTERILPYILINGID